MREFSEEQVAQLLVPARVIAALEESLRHNYRKSVWMPPRTHVDVPSLGVLLIMPCQDRERGGLGIKLVLVRNRPTAGGETVRATYFLLDSETAEVKAVVAANRLTEMRTAATSAVATKYLARLDSTTLGVFGTGRQARVHIQVLPEVRKFRRVLVCGSSPQRSQAFVRQLSPEQALTIEAADARRCIAESDVVCTCTTSQIPLFEGRWLRPGTHLNLVGAFQPNAREVDDETIRRSRVVVDTYEGALAEAGDLLIPLERGVIRREHIGADLHEIVSGKRPGRQSAEEITVFKSVGFALEDLVTAKLVCEQDFSAPGQTRSDKTGE
ncbi:MAG TPA: ornithine cyclodeaminase family protein [Candidatus Acidoferrales bacterium]|nr:ornithine cyclodeaminase family protein [Candidatus Acidoferrales bacterium]